ncbi:MAG: ATP-binding protein [Rikenellaceae bacterium]|nr:ATP-binding protein [Rikenellaceae bacterium]
MSENHNYIKTVAIKGLWGKYDLEWHLNPDVNILSGINGSGKSTVIRSLVEILRSKELPPQIRGVIEEIDVIFENGEMLVSGGGNKLSDYSIDVVSTFDNRMKELEAMQRLSDGFVRTELDWELYMVQRRYMSYQLEQSRNMIHLLQSRAPQEELDKITGHRTLFFDMMDKLFAQTGSVIDRESDEICFYKGKQKISVYMLSSGEKQLLLILTTVLTQDYKPYILLMDEPEISLHFDWQGTLIENIRTLNPNVQLIMSTHSPAVIMKGWLGHVTEMSDIVIKERAE